MMKYGVLGLSVIVIACIVVIYFFSEMFVTIETGEKGIIFYKFGGGLDKKEVLGQGLHTLAPWNTCFVYDTRIQESGEEMEVLASNGLSILLDLSYRYSPIPEEIGYLHEEIGEDFHRRIVIPEIRSSTRKVIGKYLPEELYSTKREVIQEEIFHQTDAAIKKKHIKLDALLIRSIKLPETIKVAIESKLKQEQESMEYEFKISKEKKEAERKRIEAQGIKDFQNIVSEGISDKLLRWKGIEATQELAKSQNSKVVIVGNGKDGLPVILGRD
ncbi:MAG: prohibitin family protein [Bacteroidia bacterium]|nr:prohibitin family protein [Bacteroidia bacterium]